MVNPLKKVDTQNIGEAAVGAIVGALVLAGVQKLFSYANNKRIEYKAKKTTQSEPARAVSH